MPAVCSFPTDESRQQSWWKHRRLDHMLAMYGGGATLGEIADAFHISVATTACLLAERMLADEMKALRSSRVTLRQIGAFSGVSKNQARVFLQGMPRPEPARSVAWRAYLRTRMTAWLKEAGYKRCRFCHEYRDVKYERCPECSPKKLKELRAKKDSDWLQERILEWKGQLDAAAWKAGAINEG
jgi:hypothetical protein